MTDETTDPRSGSERQDPASEPAAGGPDDPVIGVDDHVNADENPDAIENITVGGNMDAGGSPDVPARESVTAGTEVEFDAVQDGSAETGATDPDDAPLSGLSDELVSEAPSGTLPSSSDAEYRELFDEVDVGDLNSDRLWAQLAAEDDGPTVNVINCERRDIEKRRYCHQCIHFSDPPDVQCERDGTSILELVDSATFRVANCPVVLEEESLESQ